MNSALKEGIVIGIVATMREFELPVSHINIKRVLKIQQGWSDLEIAYFLDWLLIFDIQD